MSRSCGWPSQTSRPSWKMPARADVLGAVDLVNDLAGLAERDGDHVHDRVLPAVGLVGELELAHVYVHQRVNDLGLLPRTVEERSQAQVQLAGAQRRREGREQLRGARARRRLHLALGDAEEAPARADAQARALHLHVEA